MDVAGASLALARGQQPTWDTMCCTTIDLPPLPALTALLQEASVAAQVDGVSAPQRSPKVQAAVREVLTRAQQLVESQGAQGVGVSVTYSGTEILNISVSHT